MYYYFSSLLLYLLMLEHSVYNNYFILFHEDLSSYVMPSLTEEQQTILNNARSLVNKALEVDEMGEHEKALPLYIDAVEVCSSAVSQPCYFITY